MEQVAHMIQAVLGCTDDQRAHRGKFADDLNPGTFEQQLAAVAEGGIAQRIVPIGLFRKRITKINDGAFHRTYYLPLHVFGTFSLGGLTLNFIG